jgi:hypothetical protein
VECGEMNLYAVFKEAVYRHECGGIFATLDDAVIAADTLAENDVDNHHIYQVYDFTLNRINRQIKGKIVEAPSLYSIRKKQ